MKRVIAAGLVLVGSIGIAAQSPPQFGDPKRPLRLLVTVGGQPFDEAAFDAMLNALPEVKWTKAIMPGDAGLLKPGLEKEYDALLLFDMYARTPAEQKALDNLMSRRMGFVVANLANPTWNGGEKMVGGKVVARSGGPARYNVKVADTGHAITRGVKDFALTDQVTASVARSPDTLLVLRADNTAAGDDGALAWSLMHGEPYGLARIFVMRIGNQRTAWDDPNWRRVLGQGLRWTTCAAYGRFC